MANSLQERLKLKQYQVDTWTPKEQLCLASAVMRSGDQNWVAVSRTIKTLTTETNRPLDWYSTKNCALMYAKLLEKVDTPKRKRERGEPTSTNIETPGEIVTKMLAKQRIEELRVLEAQSRTSYNHLRQQIQHLEAGMLDHTLDSEWEAFIRERKEEEEKERLHREWLKQREEKIHAIQKALKHQIPKVPISSSSSGLHKKKVGDRPSWPSSSSSERRDSGMSDNSELDTALDSPGISSPMVEESQQSETETKPVPTSPLLSSLLSKPPNPPSNSNVAADLRQSFNLSSSRGRVGLSPNVSSALQNLVSSAISGTDATHKDHQKNTSTSPGSAAPTLSRLLELPPRPPGDPMPSITDLPPTHAETMAQVHKGSPPELKKAKLDIEVLAAEAAESFLSDSLLNDLDDQLDDEVMDEGEDDKKDDDLSSATPSQAVPQEGGKIREPHSLEMRGTNLSSSLKLHGGKADPQKCIYDVSGSESSPETDADLPLEEDKKGEETEPQVGDKRKAEEEKEKEEKLPNNLHEHEVIDKEKVIKNEREEIYKIKNAVVEIIKDKKIENMIKKSESYNSEDREDEKTKDLNIKTKNENGEEKKIDDTSKDDMISKVESVEKVDRKKDGSHKRKSEGKDDKDKYRRSDKKKDKKSDKDHKRSKKSKKYKHKDKTESEKDESEKELKNREKRSDKEKSKDRKSEKEKEKSKSKDKRRESRSEKEKLKDKKDTDKDDKSKKSNKKDKDDITEKKHDRHKNKNENERIKIKRDNNISISESDREKDNEDVSNLNKEKKSKSKKTPDLQGEANKNEKLDKNKKVEVEKEINSCIEGVKDIKKSEMQDKNQSNEIREKGTGKHLSGIDDNMNDTTDDVKTDKLELSSSISYADKVKMSKNDIESIPIEGPKAKKDVDVEKKLDSKNIEKQESILIDEEMEHKENNCNVNNTGINENEKQKSNRTEILDQNCAKENMRDVDSVISKHEETLNKSSEVKAKSISNQDKTVSCGNDGNTSDALDDMNLKERKKKMSGGLGKSDVFPAVDSPMDDLEQTEDIKVSYGQRSDSWRNMRKFMDDDSMDSTKNKNEKEDISDINIKKSLGERQEHIVKLEKIETNVMSLDISQLLTKEGNEVGTKKSLKDDKEMKENELEEILLKLDDEDKESPVVEKRGRKKKKVVDLEDEFLNEDSRDAMSEEEMVHARGGKRKSSGSDLFAVASPFVPESNPCSPASTLWGDENDAEKAYRAWKKPIMILWNEIAAHKFASVFLRPITDDQAPGYHDVIHRPMDLKSIKARIENGTITSTSEFQRDIMLMFLNATMYNTSDHNVYQMATRMMRDTVTAIEEFRTTQMLARASDTPIKSLRRETRESSAKRGDDDPKRKGFETPEIKKRL